MNSSPNLLRRCLLLIVWIVTAVPAFSQLKLPWQDEKKKEPPKTPPSVPVAPPTAPVTPPTVPTPPTTSVPMTPPNAPTPPIEPEDGEKVRAAAVERFFTAVRANQMDAAYQCMSEDYRKEVSQEVFSEFVQFWGLLIEHQSHTLKEIFYRRDVATIHASLKVTSDSGMLVDFHLMRDDPGWRIEFIGMMVAENSDYWEAGQTPAPAPKVPTWEDMTTRLLLLEEVSALPAETLRLLRNEIFARHGYQFRAADMADYFGKQDWYRPTTTDQQGIEKGLPPLEKTNLETIVAEEQRR